MPHAPSAAAPASTDANALADAGRALWSATLMLMTAFMQTAAPAHRYLLARRIARNFGTLREQDCFSVATRKSFSRLADRWGARANLLAPADLRTAPSWRQRLAFTLRAR